MIVNAEGQKKLRDVKRQTKLVRKYNSKNATVSHNTIQTILKRNKVVEDDIIQKLAHSY